jgi:threonyl-tRNA synthetase
VLTIAERHDAYAENIVSELSSQGMRVELDTDTEKIGNKIRKSSVRKIPYSVIIGDKEVEESRITVRRRNGENIGPFTLDELTSFLLEEINSRR